ncbi:MAG: hypothetical protein ACRDGI_00805, partial [Candidatus Limnocylindrales bacterium]
MNVRSDPPPSDPLPSDPLLSDPLLSDRPALGDEGSLEVGVARSRGGFVARLRGLLGGSTDGPSWDDVEEALIGGDVGAGLAIEVVERARARRDPAGNLAAVRAELAALLVTRDPSWRPQA